MKGPGMKGPGMKDSGSINILDGFDAATFGEIYADEYDEQHDPGTTESAVALLTELAGDRSTLELAIGTGRIAIPMAEQGIQISGLDGSPEMLAKLEEKKGSLSIPTTVADMSDYKMSDTFGFAFLIFNTFYNLTSQQAQVNCFRATADHLESGGHFLVEMFVPDFDFFSGIRLRDLDMNSMVLEGAKHDPVTQTVEFQRATLKDGGISLRPLAMRYAWPSEIDLMAKLAGLELESRWSDWNKSPFTADSKMHVSLYRKT